MPSSSAATTQQPATSRWHNHLPAWIVNDPSYDGLRQPYRQTLQAVANRCDAADDDLVGAFGGTRLCDAAGVCTRTFWRHLRVLEGLGFVVTMGRGGTFGGKNYGNQYGIPGKPGSLNGRRCVRERRRMDRGDDGVYRPVVVTPGSQMELWSGVTSCHGRRAKLSRAACQTVTPPSPYESPYEFPAGVGVSTETTSRPAPEAPQTTKRQRQRARRVLPARLGRVSPDDLSSARRVLILFSRACKLGLCVDSDHARILFAGAAIHAKRVGNNPPALFAAIVNRGMWLMVTADDEGKANTWIKPAMYDA